VALCCNFGSAGGGAESPLSRLQLVRGRFAPGASGWFDPAGDPNPGPSAEMRASGEDEAGFFERRLTCLAINACLFAWAL
jgi:hypothetical protein